MAWHYFFHPGFNWKELLNLCKTFVEIQTCKISKFKRCHRSTRSETVTGHCSTEKPTFTLPVQIIILGLTSVLVDSERQMTQTMNQIIAQVCGSPVVVSGGHVTHWSVRREVLFHSEVVNSIHSQGQVVVLVLYWYVHL